MLAGFPFGFPFAGFPLWAVVKRDISGLAEFREIWKPRATEPIP